MNVRDVASAGLYVASLLLAVSALFMTIMATKMLFTSRGEVNSPKIKLN